jgi:hypothetical protein
MKELMIVLAKEAPLEILLEQLREAILKLKVVENEETKRTVLFHCYMMIYRLGSEGRSSFDVIKEVADASKILEHFKESRQPS